MIFLCLTFVLSGFKDMAISRMMMKNLHPLRELTLPKLKKSQLTDEVESWILVPLPIMVKELNLRLVFFVFDCKYM